jgi:hypothetical protein
LFNFSIPSQWQPCSVSCGIGFQFRERFCGEKPCFGGGKQARTCNVQVGLFQIKYNFHLKKDCSRILDSPVWSEWSLWSACSHSCGQGIQQRIRRCLNGICPNNEPQKEQKRCVLGPCPQVRGFINLCEFIFQKSGQHGRLGQNAHLAVFLKLANGKGNVWSGWPTQMEMANGRRRNWAMRHAQVEKNWFEIIVN